MMCTTSNNAEPSRYYSHIYTIYTISVNLGVPETRIQEYQTASSPIPSMKHGILYNRIIPDDGGSTHT